MDMPLAPVREATHFPVFCNDNSSVLKKPTIASPRVADLLISPMGEILGSFGVHVTCP